MLIEFCDLPNLYRMDQSSEGGWWTDLVTRVHDGAGLEDISFTMPQQTQEIGDMTNEVQLT